MCVVSPSQPGWHQGNHPNVTGILTTDQYLITVGPVLIAMV